jgi:NADPH:quinone reductase-like Zn-dependent oxidoreductase
MKAVLLTRYGPPEVLEYADVALPEPRDGEIRIRVKAATVNSVLDVALRAGKVPWHKPSLPLIPGVDCAGVIDAIGPGIRKWQVGQHVAAANLMPIDPITESGAGYSGRMGLMGIHRPGAFAQFVTVPACAASEIPAELGFYEAAVAIRHLPTAWNLLFNLAKVKQGETVVVMGASGNLGLLGVQLCKRVANATVIAVAGSEERAAKAASAGADHVIDASSCSDIGARIRDLAAGNGVDVVYDNSANPGQLAPVFLTLRRGGRLVSAATQKQSPVGIDFSHLSVNSISILGSTGSSRSDVAKCIDAVASGKVRADYSHVLPLSKVVDAHRLVESGLAEGKIVLDPTIA